MNTLDNQAMSLLFGGRATAQQGEPTDPDVTGGGIAAEPQTSHTRPLTGFYGA